MVLETEWCPFDQRRFFFPLFFCDREASSESSATAKACPFSVMWLNSFVLLGNVWLHTLHLCFAYEVSQIFAAGNRLSQTDTSPLAAAASFFACRARLLSLFDGSVASFDSVSGTGLGRVPSSSSSARGLASLMSSTIGRRLFFLRLVASSGTIGSTLLMPMSDNTFARKLVSSASGHEGGGCDGDGDRVSSGVS